MKHILVVKGGQIMDDEACDRIEEVMRVSHKYRFLKIEGIFNGVSRSEFLALMLIDKVDCPRS